MGFSHRSVGHDHHDRPSCGKTLLTVWCKAHVGSVAIDAYQLDLQKLGVRPWDKCAGLVAFMITKKPLDWLLFRGLTLYFHQPARNLRHLCYIPRMLSHVGIWFRSQWESTLLEQMEMAQQRYVTYPLVNSHITMENHHFQWLNPLFQWDILNSKLLVITRGYWQVTKKMPVWLELILEPCGTRIVEPYLRWWDHGKS